MQLSNHFLSLQKPPIIFRHVQRHHRRLLCKSAVLSLAKSSKLSLRESLQEETLKSLEWPTLCHQLSSFAQTSMGVSVTRKAQIPFGKSLEESQKLLNQTSAAVAMMQYRPLDLSNIDDISGIVNSASCGQLLTASEICAVRRFLRAVGSVWENMCEASAANADSSGRYC